MTMSPSDAVRARRSIKKFTARPVTRAEIEGLLDLAALAPNHRMTEPWGYVVLGSAAKKELGRIRGNAKAASVAEAGAARAVRDKVSAEIEAVPAIVAFTQRLDPRPEVREEDYAAVCMGIQSFLIGAAAAGLGTQVKTGSDLELPETRKALAVEEGVRIVALVHVGEPAEVPPPRPRAPARDRTRWLP